jgi:tetratricopeptide (TPR) repeat protein
MPIRREGTPEHTHFKAFYEEILKPCLVGHGYDVTRADEVGLSGAITRDIVLRLGDADLVVADLTDLNPNVFYELGVRHSLRGRGTIMIVDETRTDNIPFDLGAYRVIKFKGELAGFAKLRQEIMGFIQSAAVETGTTYRDNPVHDWIPALPVNAIQAAADSLEGELRTQLAKAQQTIRQYEEAYGIRKQVGDATTNPLSIVMQALSEAQEGNLPSDLLEAAEEATRRRDTRTFLTILRRILEKDVMPLQPRGFLALTAFAQRFELDIVMRAIYDHALRLYPTNRELRNAQLASLAHADNPGIREQARRELQELIGLTSVDGRITVAPNIQGEDMLLLGVLCDAFHADDLHPKVLELTTALLDRYADRAIVARNHARALKLIGKHHEALEWYQRALHCPDADDASAVWFGSTLHNDERYVDAVEAYLVATLMDPDDAANFAHVADDIAFAMREELVGTRRDSRRLPKTADGDSVKAIITAALSCNIITQEAVDRCRRAALRAEIEMPRFGVDPLSIDDGDTKLEALMRPMTVRERVELCRGLYDQLRTSLTSVGQTKTSSS